MKDSINKEIEKKEDIENGLFITDYNQLVENSWLILLRKKDNNSLKNLNNIEMKGEKK